MNSSKSMAEVTLERERQQFRLAEERQAAAGLETALALPYNIYNYMCVLHPWPWPRSNPFFFESIAQLFLF